MYNIICMNIYSCLKTVQTLWLQSAMVGSFAWAFPALNGLGSFSLRSGVHVSDMAEPTKEKVLLVWDYESRLSAKLTTADHLERFGSL